MFRTFSASEDGLNFVILINYIARNSGDSDEFTLLVADYNRRTADNTGLGEQYVVHNYTKVVKVNGQFNFFNCFIYSILKEKLMMFKSIQ